MSSLTRLRFDVLVVGGGPAGIAAAVCAAESGQLVGLVDDNPRLGGQIWRYDLEKGSAAEAAEWLDRVRRSSVAILNGARAFQQPAPHVLLAEGIEQLYELRYRNLILATGARERLLPFPGWTLPNVMGAGGLQALVKAGLPVDGRRIVIAGSGPLLLAAAAFFRERGAEIPIVAEQASWRRLAGFGASLPARPGKIVEALQLFREIRGIPFAANSWPIAAHGKERLEGVTLRRNGKTHTLPCDYLACGFHLVPNIELPALLRCEIRGGQVVVNRLQQTSVESIYCAGEPTGIGGLDLALVEGRIAGLAAAGRSSSARELFARRARLGHFSRALDRGFKLRAELRRLPQPETLVCRCEDVRYDSLGPYTSWRAAKLQTRCGMGPCQGRICGSAAEFLFDWSPDSVRPPVFPARVESLAGMPADAGAEREGLTGGRQ